MKNQHGPMALADSFTLATNRLLLRQPLEADIAPILAATRVPGFNDGMTWEPPADETLLREHLQTILACWAEGSAYVFSITDRNTGELLGRISIRHLERHPAGVWDLGAFTLPAHQGKGIMSEALACMVRFGFETMGASRLEACHAHWNKASERVLIKLGFRFVRYIQHGFQKNGHWVAENLLALERAAWQKGSYDRL